MFIRVKMSPWMDEIKTYLGQLVTLMFIRVKMSLLMDEIKT